MVDLADLAALRIVNVGSHMPMTAGNSVVGNSLVLVD